MLSLMKLINKIDHASIEKIEVRAINDRTLAIKAFSNESLIKEEVFVEGNDFKISSERILLKRHALFSLAYPSGNPLKGSDTPLHTQ